MQELFYMGGTLFMGILTLMLLIIFCIAVASAVGMNNTKIGSYHVRRHQLGYIKAVGLLALVFGMLGQLIALYSAFQDIEVMGSVSTAMLAAGLRVSSICTLYGMVIFLFSYLIWFVLELWLNRLEKISQELI